MKAESGEAITEHKRDQCSSTSSKVIVGKEWPRGQHIKVKADTGFTQQKYHLKMTSWVGVRYSEHAETWTRAPRGEQGVFSTSGSCNDLQLGDMVQLPSKDIYELVWVGYLYLFIYF